MKTLCFREEETPVKSVLEIHKKVKNLLKDFDQKLQNIDNYKLQLEKEVEVLKRKLAIKKQKNLIGKWILPPKK